MEGLAYLVACLRDRNCPACGAAWDLAYHLPDAELVVGVCAGPQHHGWSLGVDRGTETWTPASRLGRGQGRGQGRGAA